MPSTVGQRIREIREEQGLSQNALAKKAGISQAGLSAIESTTKSPSIEILGKIADALKTSVASLTNDQESLEEVYFRFAKDAEKNQIDPNDIALALDIIKRAREKK